MELLSTRVSKFDKSKDYNLDNLSGLSLKCDWFIKGDKLIKIKDTNTPKFIFLALYYPIPLAYFINQVLPRIKNYFILITGDEDCTFPLGIGDKREKLFKIFPKEQVDIILNNKFLLHIFSENLDTDHDMMSPIPTGMGYPLDGKQYIYGNPPRIDINNKLFTDIDFDKKEVLCFCTHRTRWGKIHHRIQNQDRYNVGIYCRNKWKNFVTYYDSLPNQLFVEMLKKSKFCLCVHGGGMDPCPRFFEAIIHGSIPVIQHSPLDKLYSIFPVVYIDEWNENCISEEFLLKKLEELRNFYENEDKRKEILRYLTMDYWWNKIEKKYEFCLK